ncbi:MAG: GTP 3',8-cyclase MoaA [Flavobacteriales bacterium]|nr:GTP 3',8-cyclase MoaA [Flavobacteriales bacterium]MCW8913564.1 GTP 3',8-cyclase MoaA [Flavobacteriales bacterium]MCW8936611.1 GTP 3',8-cyclase MoaA [Flavobacteriales bacterium]MCW8940266.1 GTP 3',8-cyclase MoaA [Flavobacteriales bacterium]MCW8967880.1 GTP 3',8-cyclase MoaA [Flavobacteriales bacterium]
MNSASQIKDQFGRVHDYLRISLTERCNLRCFYCMPAEGIELSEKSHLMSHEEVIAIAKTFVEMGVKKIRLTGGEPLIKKNIEKIITELTQLPINLGITTNGILLDNYFELFKTSGVKDINISLDTLDKKKFEEITRRDYFDRVISNINLYEANGFNVKINNVIIKDVNDNEINDFIEFTKDKNVAIRFIEFMPFDGNKWSTEKVITLNEILSAAEKKYGSENIINLKSKKNGTAKNFQIKGYKGSFGVISTVSNPFCDSCNRIRLTANGRIKNCLFSTSETNLLTPLRNGEDIKSIIMDGIYHKKQVRGGMTSDKDFFDPEKNANNRTMIAIGG